MSVVWNYFIQIQESGIKNGRCTKCSKILTSSKSSTSGLIARVKSCHKIDLRATNENDEPPTKKQKVSEQPSLAEMLAKLMSCDGLTAHSIEKSETLNYIFSSSGYSIPQSPNIVMAIITKFYEEKKQEMIAEFAELKKNCQKFSMTLDE